jgi:hemolysin activation/secretion protein
VGADVTLDTRVDPLLPRNAVYARVAWERLNLDPRAVRRTDLDLRGYAGVVGQTVLAVRAVRQDASAPLPPYLKPLLGGLANLRGFRVGTAAGDTLVAASAELIAPLTSPLHVGRAGVSAFVDVGTAYDEAARLSDQRMKQGVGGTVWLSAAFLKVTLAVAHGRGGTTRVHAGGNVSF